MSTLVFLYCILAIGLTVSYGFLEFPGNTTTSAKTAGTTSSPPSGSQPTTQDLQIQIDQLEEEINDNYQVINEDNNALKQELYKLQDEVTILKEMAGELTCARNSTQEVAADMQHVKELLNHVLSNSSFLQPKHCIPVIQIPPVGSVNPLLPRDCLDVYAANHTQAGVYLIQPDNSPQAVSAYCENGWTYIQRRLQGQLQDFDQYWDAYSMGFNQSSNDLWLGNEHVFYLTHQGNYTLRVEAEGWTGKKYWAQYGTFYIDDEADGYELHVGNYSGNYKDALGSSNGLKFTTKDVDNDNMGSGNCALQYSGGWWSDDCGMSLNRRLLQHDRYCANFCDRCIKTSSMKIIRTTALTYL